MFTATETCYILEFERFPQHGYLFYDRDVAMTWSDICSLFNRSYVHILIKGECLKDNVVTDKTELREYLRQHLHAKLDETQLAITKLLLLQ